MIDRVLKLLNHFAEQPGMYLHPVDVATVRSYLTGLETGCGFAGLHIPEGVYEEVAASRGWKQRAAGIIWHMRAKNLDDQAVIQELIAVQAEAFRRVARPQESHKTGSGSGNP